MSTAPLTIGEARPNVARAGIVIGTIFLVAYILAAGYMYMSVLLSWDPLLLHRFPLLLPLWILWGVYLSLAHVIRSYANLYLPRTPMAVDDGFMDVAIVAIGGWALGPMEFVVLGLPVQDQRIVVACIGVLATLIAGLIVFWAWLIRKYGGPAFRPTKSIAFG